jgi:EmrB/QacA subfamily drug resistance transporter
MSTRHRFLITIALVILIFMELLDGSILNTAIPTSAKSMALPVLSLRTSITSYLIVVAILTPISGYVADRFGAKACLYISISTFMFGSVLCSLATTASMLSLFRIFQGGGAAMMVPVARLLVIRLYTPEEMARVTSTITVPIIFGPLLGPIVGGVVTTYFRWEWVFWINIPFAITALGLIYKFLPEDKVPNMHKLNYISFFLAAVCFACIDFALENVETIPRQSMIATIIGVISGCVYLLHSRQTRNPIFDFKLLKIHLFCLSIINTLLVNCAAAAISFLLCIILQQQLKLSPVASGFATFPIALGVLLIKLCLSKIYRSQDNNFAIILPFAAVMVGFSMVCFTFVGSGFSYFRLVIIELIFGIGFGLSLNTSNISCFYTMPPELKSKAISFQSSIYLLANSLSVGIASLIFGYFIYHDGGKLGVYTIIFNAFHKCCLILSLFSFASAGIMYFINSKHKFKLALSDA